MSTPLTCPFCNAVVPLSGAVQPGEIVNCPRCDERFKSLSEAAATTTSSELPLPASVKTSWSNRKLALTVLSVMGFMALVATIFALSTQHIRREHDKGLPGRGGVFEDIPYEDDDEVRPLSPLQMEAVQRLSPRMDVLAGIHVALLRQEKQASALLKKPLPVLGINLQSIVLERFPELTGMKLQAVDHVALGVRFDGLGIVLAVRTRAAIDKEAVVRALKARAAARHSEAWKRGVLEFKAGLPFYENGLLKIVNSRELLVGLNARVEDVALAATDEGPSEEMKTLLRPMSPSGPIWIAGKLPQFGSVRQSLEGKGITIKDDGWFKTVSGIESVALWLTLEQPMTVRAVVRARSVKARNDLEGYVRKEFGLQSERWIGRSQGPNRILRDREDPLRFTVQYRLPQKQD